MKVQLASKDKARKPFETPLVGFVVGVEACGVSKPRVTLGNYLATEVDSPVILLSQNQDRTVTYLRCHEHQTLSGYETKRKLDLTKHKMRKSTRGNSH